ncbi:MAG: hypothetical protein GEU81_18230 [Nitriliruptorales bacterium]|nr:hypothetical protein [Nitriliruptorales bacterium]
MQFDKSQIVDFLNSQGDQTKAQQADRDLPGKVDTNNPDHKSMLDRFGIDLNAMAGKFLGGKGIPGF